MSGIGIHPRVMRRHPELRNEDIVATLKSMIRYQQRDSGEWLAVGIDGNNRLVEVVYEYDAAEDYFFVYHGMTPPSRKTLVELGLERTER